MYYLNINTIKRIFLNFKNISKFYENIFKLKIIFKIITKHTLIHM